MSTHTLMDADTAEPIGPATPEQVEASNDTEAKDGGAGIILVDRAGHVVDAGSWYAHQPGTRRCYTQVAD